MGSVVVDLSAVAVIAVRGSDDGGDGGGDGSSDGSGDGSSGGGGGGGGCGDGTVIAVMGGRVKLAVVAMAVVAMLATACRHTLHH